MNIVFLLAVAAMVLLTVVGLREWYQSRSNARQGIFDRNISDEEFLAAVPHATPERALRIRAIISEQLDIPERCIHPHDNFVDDLHAG